MSTLVVSLFLFAASALTAATFSYFIGGRMVSVQISVLAIPTFFLATIFASFWFESWLLRFAGKIASIAMGFLNFAFLAALLCWPTMGLITLCGLNVDRAGAAWALLGISAGVAVYGLVNANRVRLTRYTVQLENLPAIWQDKNVVLVSDMHVGSVRGPRFARKIVAMLCELEPTAVFIPGDMFDGARLNVEKAVRPWADFSAPRGTYFVTGNHDEFRDPAPYLAALANVGIRVLNNEKVIVDGLQIIGVQDAVTHDPALFRELLTHAQIDPVQPSILLAHRPAYLEIPAGAGVSLQVSGHTHAGQFPLWTHLVRKIYGRFAYGFNRLGSLQVITSSGAGTGGPPLRVGTRSEIVVVRLETAGNPLRVAKGV